MKTSFIRLFNPKIPSLNGGFSVSKSGSLFCFKNFPNLHYKNRALVTGGSTCNVLMSGFWARYLQILHTYKQKPDKYSCIRSSRDRLGFYADINILFLVHFVYLYDTLFCFEKTSLHFSSIKSKTIVVLLFRATNL